PLNGTWKLRAGENKPALQPAYNDSLFANVQVPAYWETQGFGGFIGLALYRKTFTMPANARHDWPDGRLYLALGKISSIDEVYMNGVLIGRTGTLKDLRPDDDRIYPVPDSLLRYGAENTLAVRVFSTEQGGGLYQGFGAGLQTVGLFDKTALRELLGKPSVPAGKGATDSVIATVKVMDKALAAGNTDLYAQFLSPDYFNNGTAFEEQRLFIQAVSPSLKDATFDYRDAKVYQISGELVVIDYETTLKRNGEVFYEATDERYFRRETGAWREVGNRARFFDLSVKSAAMGEMMDVSVYLPPSYLKSRRTYPVLYLLHAAGTTHAMWKSEKINEMLDSLINAKAMSEMIVVMPSAKETYFVNRNPSSGVGGQGGQGGQGGLFETYFLSELPEAVEPDYRVRRERTQRGIDGISLGGFAAFHLALRTAEGRALFSSVGSVMGAMDVRFRGERTPAAGDTAFWTPYLPVNLVKEIPADTLRKFAFYFSVGKKDFVRKGNESVSRTLSRKKIAHTFRLDDGSHDRAFWRTHLAENLRFHSEQFRLPQKKEMR
ncbi:MAG: hypothetical protein IAF08_15210, partial [Rhizobacter sp.]|nr:hypothetical protein [Chlorobiales bacterium]